MLNKRDLVAFRPALNSDVPLIYSTWLHGIAKEKGWFLEGPAGPKCDHYRTFIDRIIESPDSKVLIACLKDDPDVILGYSVTQPKILHWVYVKPVWRGIGLSKDLASPDIEIITNLTSSGRILCPRHLIYQPLEDMWK